MCCANRASQLLEGEGHLSLALVIPNRSFESLPRLKIDPDRERAHNWGHVTFASSDDAALSVT
jgi:hypothetical protein